MARQRLTQGWAVCMDAEGNMSILDHRGERPLEDPDPVQRLANFYLAAASPVMRESLEALAGAVERLVGDGYAYQWRKDAKILMFARAGLVMSTPLGSEVAKMIQLRQQQQSEESKRAA